MKSAIAAPMSRVLDTSIRRMIADAFDQRPAAHPDELGALRAEVRSLHARIDGLEKRLAMAMGAIEACTEQLIAVKNGSDRAHQLAVTARSTAEAAADGVANLEDQLTDGLAQRAP